MAEDVEVLYESVFSQAEVMRYLPGSRVLNGQETKDFIHNKFTFNEHNIGLGSLVEQKSQQVIGFAGLLYCDYFGKQELECGYAISQPYWRQGYASEICKALIETSLNQLNYPRVLATVSPENTGSIHVLKKYDFEHVETRQIVDRGIRGIFVRNKATETST